jgi:hypothetical protein
MKTLALPLTQSSPDAPDTWSYGVLGDHLFRDRTHPFSRLLGWWSRHTSPPDARPGATFAQRDLVRRGRIASSMMLFLAVLLLFVAVIGVLGPNKNLLTVVYTIYPIIAVCLFLNRKGHVTWAGILLSLGMVGGMCMTLFSTALHGGISPTDKDILYLLFFDELFFALLLPINTVFLVAVLNLLISLVVLNLAPHTPALTVLLAQGGYASILFRLVQIHVLVPFALWVLVTIMQEQTRRANTAEELARLQHDVSQLTSQQAEQKAALEQSIALIVQVHTRVANGDLDARVPLTHDLVLWNVAGQLNTLIARYQKARQEVQQAERLVRSYERMMSLYPVFRQTVQRALRDQRPFEMPRSETVLDLFFKELNGVCLAPSSFQLPERGS